MTNILEPNGASTGYGYDALGNLQTVNQLGVAGDTPRTRNFVYDGLSRVTTSTKPETGTVSYGYDANSNHVTKTDARGITVTASYDALNRMIGKTYSDSTPPVRLSLRRNRLWGQRPF